MNEVVEFFFVEYFLLLKLIRESCISHFGTDLIIVS